MSVREKLVELIGSTEYGNGSLVGKNFQKGFIEKIASNLIANGVTVQDSKGVEIDPFNKWISVKDRLPEKVGTRVLTYSPEDGVNIGKFIGYNAFVVHLWDVFCHQHRTTHWMPLPAPPEGIWL